MYTLYCLATHPECLEKVQAELDDIFGSDTEREVTVEDMGRMDFLGRCVKEALRPYSVVPIITRSCKEDWNFKVKWI